MIKPKPSVLIVSVAFPPKSDAEGLQVAKYLKFLSKENGGRYEFDALTSTMPTLNMGFDPSLEKVAHEVRQRVELPIYENRYLNFALRKLAPNLAYSPDTRFTFHWQAKLAAKKLREPPSILYSRSFPPTSAVMARKLKKIFDVPWIMHLSDLWADDPDAPYRGSTIIRNQQMEYECIRTADVICLTSEKTIQFFEQKYRGLNKRFELFPNVYDAEDAPPHSSRQVKNVLKIVHTGSLAGLRSPESFLRAVASLPSEAQERIDIVFAGPMDRKNSAVFKAFKIPAVSYVGSLSYAEAINLQQTADALLLIDMPVADPEKRVFLPSKLLDYMLTGKPVIALVDKDSEVDQKVREGLGESIERNDLGKIRKHLLWLISENEKNSDYFAAREPLKEYDASVNARRLLHLFDEFAIT